MIARKNRRHRDPSPMFPFGDIMLPVIGIVALGLLVVGIKMFFLPAAPEKEYTPVPTPKVVQKQENNNVNTINKPVTEPKLTTEKVLPETARNIEPVAVPVSSSHKTSSQTETSAKPQKNQPIKKVKDGTLKPTEKQLQTKTDKPLNNNLPTSSKVTVSTWNVQIGSFAERKAAETVVRQAGEVGFTAKITQASVKNKTYHRVFVPAGSDKTDALLLEKKLKNKGFPTFITRYSKP